jgi:hypothetical protein
MFTSVALIVALAAGSPAQMDDSLAYLALVERLVPETADHVVLELADWPEKRAGSAVEVLRGRGAVTRWSGRIHQRSAGWHGQRERPAGRARQGDGRAIPAHAR